MENMIAVVTGGTRGIGLGIAESLLKRGASVAVTYHHDENAAARAADYLGTYLKKERQLLTLRCDNADPEAVGESYRRLSGELGQVSVLVNNAGIMPQRSFEELGISDWDQTLRVNLSGAFYWASLVIPDMKARSFGRIVNVASLAARGGGVVGPHYAASKAGMLGLTRYAARELGSWGITVNALAPAFIEDAGIFSDWNADQLETLKAKVLVPRIGKVQDVVRAFEYLLDSPFVTGVTLDVNGGTFMI